MPQEPRGEPERDAEIRKSAYESMVKQTRPHLQALRKEVEEYERNKKKGKVVRVKNTHATSTTKNLAKKRAARKR